MERETKRPRLDGHCRNAEHLATNNPLSWDKWITFDEQLHEYRTQPGNERVPYSASDLVKMCFPVSEFKPREIAAKNLALWRSRASSEYHPLVVGKPDEDAIDAVCSVWEQNNARGTKMHKLFELLLNGVHVPADEDEFLGHDRDRDAFAKFRTDHIHLEPYRTEISMYYKNADGVVVCAGQPDVIFKDRRDHSLVIVDFKRVRGSLTPANPANPAYTSTARQWRNESGVGAMSGIASSKHNHYSLQQSIYAVMFEFLTGEEVSKMFLLQIDPDGVQEYRLIRCNDLRVKAKQALDTLAVANATATIKNSAPPQAAPGDA